MHAIQPPSNEWPASRGLQNWRLATPLLFWAGASMLLLAVVSGGLTFLDGREFHGVSVWLKPWKFQISTSAYFLTLALFMAWLPEAALRTWAVRYVVWAALVSGLFEVGYITWQASLGEASHFNTSTPVHAALYTAMGIMAVVLTSTSAVLGAVIARNPAYRLPSALKLAVVLGLTGTFVLGTGFGAYLGSQPTGHWVGGAPTDAGGLPLLKWSRTGGDLRVAHFFGIHAMHFIPAFAWIWVWLRAPQRWVTAAVWTFSFLFAVGTTWTFLQAVRGQPFLG
jgi:hypothetical protein